MIIPNHGRQMAIADMPGEACEAGAGARGYAHERLIGGAHPHQPTIVQLQAIAIEEYGSARQIEQEGKAAIARQRNPAPMARIMVERDDVRSRLAGPVAGGEDVVRADHGEALEKEVALREGQALRWFTGQQFAIGPHFIGF